jgi:hypothetical protein
MKISLIIKIKQLRKINPMNRKKILHLLHLTH